MAQKFAYGANALPGCNCPAAEAGKQVSGKALFVAESYDEFVTSQTGRAEGEIPKKMARENWEKAIQEMRDRASEETDSEHAEYLREAAVVGEEIAEEVF